MYEMFCASVHHLISSLATTGGKHNARLDSASTLLPLTDPVLYHEEAVQLTERYRVLGDLLHRFESHRDQYPEMGAFLWTLASRGINGRWFGYATEAQLDELTRLMGMILKFQYWDDAV